MTSVLNYLIFIRNVLAGYRNYKKAYDLKQRESYSVYMKSITTIKMPHVEILKFNKQLNLYPLNTERKYTEKY